MPALVLLALALQAPADSALAVTLDSARAAIGAPGAVAALIHPDGRLWTGASGVAATGRPALPSTPFEIGSVTKSYVAAAVIRLAARGAVDLDAAVVRYLPEAPVPEGATVRQLLNHTAGLADPMDNPGWVPQVLANPGRAWTPDDILALMGEPKFAPGAGWAYSNGGYVLLGQLLAERTGRTVGQALHDLVLEPLGLEATWFVAEDAPPSGIAHAYIDINGDGAPDDVGGFLPMTAFRTSASTAGALAATAGDVARFMRALHAGDALGRPWHGQMLTLVDRPDGLRYGLGVLVIPDLAGDEGWGHKGNSAGFSAAAFHVARTGTTVVVLTNAHLVDVTPVAAALLRAVSPEPSPRR